jgi:hypothetical protein
MKHKVCPPGVICIENMSFIFILIFIVIVVYLLYITFMKSIPVNVNNNPKIFIQREKEELGPALGLGYMPPSLGPNIPYNNFPADVLLNPYVPPLKDERYLVPPLPGYYNGAGLRDPGYGIPINISTNRNILNTQYRQVGLLTPLNSYNKKGNTNTNTNTNTEKILPLLGRPLNLGRDSWNYYTMSDQNNSVKLPILRKKKSCTGEYGCDRLYEGDVVFVQGYNQGFRATIYENDTIQYIPYL